MDAARDILASLLGLVAVVLLALWAPAAWLQRTVVDEAGFTAVAAPLGSDPAFQKAVARAGVDAALDAVQVPTLLRGQIEPLITEQAEKLTGTDTFATIWAGTARDLHATLLSPRGGVVRADLNPYVDELVRPVGDLVGQDIDIPDTDALHLEVARIPASPWPGRLTALARASSWIGWAGIAAAAIALALAAHRAVVAFALGLLTVIAGIALMMLGQGAGALIPASVAANPIVGTLVRAFLERFTSDMLVPAAVMIGAGALLVVLALVVLGVAANRRRPQVP